VAAARVVDDPAVIFGFGLADKVIEIMDTVIEKIIVCLTYPNVDLTLKLGTDRGPIALSIKTKVVFLKLLRNGVIDPSGLRVPQR
jgi:hypothetical protein